MRTAATLVFTLAIAVAGMLAFARPTRPAETPTRFYVSATLTAGQQIPPPRDAARARGKLTGSLKGRLLSWRIRMDRVAAPVTAVDIHIAPRGKANPKRAIALCVPCTTSSVGKSVLGPGTVRAMRSGNAYVDVHTKRNRRGEIRGQLRLTRRPVGTTP